MKYIKLTQGYKAKVDDDDYLIIEGFSWFYDHGYARANVGDKRYYMHQVILPFAKRIDHINGNGIDNRKSNLREATQHQNAFNHSLNKNSTSGYKGVSFHNQNKNWRAHITVNGKFLSLGSYKDKKNAILAYNQAAIKYFGEFAKLNLI